VPRPALPRSPRPSDDLAELGRGAEVVADPVLGHRPGDPGGGVGGSFACGDTATGSTWAVTKNRISNDFTTSTQLGQLIADAT